MIGEMLVLALACFVLPKNVSYWKGHTAVSALGEKNLEMSGIWTLWDLLADANAVPADGKRSGSTQERQGSKYSPLESSGLQKPYILIPWVLDPESANGEKVDTVCGPCHPMCRNAKRPGGLKSDWPLIVV